jgi:hypothetical protein
MRMLFLKLMLLLSALTVGVSMAHAGRPKSNPVLKTVDQQLKDHLNDCRTILMGLESREKIYADFLALLRKSKTWFDIASDREVISRAQSLQDPVLKQLSAAGRRAVSELAQRRLKVYEPNWLRQESLIQQNLEIRPEVYVTHPTEDPRSDEAFELNAHSGNWQRVIEYYDELSDRYRSYTWNRQQLALAYRKRWQPGDFEKAKKILLTLIRENGPDSETYGLLGSLYKQLYLTRKAEGAPEKSWKRALDQSINFYLEGVRADPADFYPSSAVISLLYTKGTPKALAQVKNLANLLNFVMLGKLGPDDKGSRHKAKVNPNETPYWRASTLLRLDILAENWKDVEKSVDRVHAAAENVWNLKSTRDDYNVLLESWIPLNQKGLISNTSIGHLIRLIERLNQAIARMENEQTQPPPGGSP